MTINRDNYEEFFILYGDNELGSEDKIRVEEFVKENPDLQAEFGLFNQLRFTPDEEIAFDHKESLMQSSGLSKNEELILLSLDGELDGSQQAEFEQLLSRDASMRAELALYKKASFDPSERIVFPYKESLYRKEEKTRVIPMGGFNWRKLAAAAAILVAVSVTAFIAFERKGNDTDNPAAIAGTGGSAGTDSVQPVTPATEELVKGNDGKNEPAAGDNTPGVQKHFDHAHDTPADKKNVASGDKKKQSPVVNKVIPVKPDVEVAKSHNNLPKPLNNPNINNVKDNNQLAVNTPPAKQVNTTTTEKNSVPVVTPKADDALQYVVNTDTDPGDDNEEMGPSSKKNKLRGFFRKVTRTFEKTTNIKATDEEDRLLVGGLAIRL